MIANVAKALANHLDTMPALATANVRFSHFAEVDASDLAQLQVVVSPRGADVLVAAKRAATYEYRVGIYIARKALTESDADAAMSATEAIMDAIHDDSWGSPNDRIGFSSMMVTLNQDDTMDESNTFRATLEVTYKVLRGQ